MLIFSDKKAKFSGLLHRQEKGQILLVVVLLMVVMLTIGLSLATRSLTNLRQSSEEDSSQRAFSAAEAGVEVAQQSGGSDVGLTKFAEGSTYEAKISMISSEKIAVNAGNLMSRNESTDIWLSTYPGFTSQWSGDLVLHWGDEAGSVCPRAAAFEIAILSGVSVTDPTLTHYAYDPCSRGNNFTSSGITEEPFELEGRTYTYRLRLPTITNGYLMRIIPLYENTRLAVEAVSGGPLPVQGRVIESVGRSGGTERKIVVVQANPKLPLEIFPYVLFTPASL